LKISSNRDLNRLALHTTLHQLAWAIYAVFSPVFLLRQGLFAAAIFLSFALIVGLRFLFRGLVLMTVMRIGLRRTLVVGTFLYGLQSPFLALVHGPGIALLSYCAISAIAQAFYWTCYQATFSAAGDIGSRGHQIGWRQILIAIASIIGPVVGGIIFATAGPWAALGTAAVIEFCAIVPLLRLTELPVARLAPQNAYPAAKWGALLLATDGWIFNSSVWIWSITMFQSLGLRYDTFGGGIAGGSLAGAVGGFVLGHFIDIGHGRRATWLSATVLAVTLLIKSFCGTDPVVVLTVAIITSLFGGLYVPSLMTVVYNEAKRSPCPFRFQFVAEAGWDVGAAMACLCVWALSAAGVPLQPIILLALPMVAIQAHLLVDRYAARADDQKPAAPQSLPGQDA
jgi:DHA1 family inner membrane transport protein